MEPWHDSRFTDLIALSEQSAIQFFGPLGAARWGLTGLRACNWYVDGDCLPIFTDEDFSGVFPLFPWGFWSKDLPSFLFRDLSRIGIFHQSSLGRTLFKEDGRMVRWVAEDDDCMLGAPQLVDLQNGRYLVGFAKFQCISDGFHLRRFTTNANGTRSVSTLIPKQYYLMEVGVDGYPLTQPTPVPDVGWGSLDDITVLGPGRASWAYISSPTLLPDGTHAAPEQSSWGLIVYTSPLD